MKKVLVTGANGQLGRCLHDISKEYNNLYFIFLNKLELDINDENAISEYFRKNAISYCINTAAYTNVDAAEENEAEAFAINAEAVKNLAKTCRKNNVILIHISTDYVFDGKNRTPYLETDLVNPINVYGKSKLMGEQYIIENCPRHFIIRTSWLYSQYGKNFFKTVKSLLEGGKPFSITTEQKGTPTNAKDLASALIKIIEQDINQYGVYHYANAGEATWFDFALAIAALLDPTKSHLVEKTAHYPTKAKRPENSRLNCDKFATVFSENMIDWKESLKINN